MRKILFCILLLTALACNLIVPPVTSVPATSVPDVPFCQPGQSITEDANGQTIRLNKGDLLRVYLYENASTGYEWLVDRIEPEKLTDVGKDYGDPSADPGMAGSGGVLCLCFQAVSAGTTTLRLIYRQPWEADATPIPYAPPDFEITIVINE